MSNLNINPKWNARINQVEAGEHISGGPDGIANIATRQLAENIFWLRDYMHDTITKIDTSLSPGDKADILDSFDSKLDSLRGELGVLLDKANQDLIDMEGRFDQIAGDSTKALEAKVNQIRKEIGVIDEAVETTIKDRLSQLDVTVDDWDKLDKEARQLLGDRFEDYDPKTGVTTILTTLLDQERTTRASADEAQTRELKLLRSQVGGEWDSFNSWTFDNDSQTWTGGTWTDGGVIALKGQALTSPNLTLEKKTVVSTDPNDPNAEVVENSEDVPLDGSRYNTIKMRIKRIGAPEWAGKITYTIEGVSETKEIPIPTVYDPEVATGIEDASGFNLLQVEMVEEWHGKQIDNISIVLSEPESETDYFEVDWVTVGRHAPTISSADILELQNTFASRDKAYANDLRSLSAQLTLPEGVGEGISNFKELVEVLVDESGAYGEHLEQLKSTYEWGDDVTSLAEAIKKFETTTVPGLAKTEATDSIKAAFAPLMKDGETVDDYMVRQAEWQSNVTAEVNLEEGSKLSNISKGVADWNDNKAGILQGITANANDHEANIQKFEDISAKFAGTSESGLKSLIDANASETKATAESFEQLHATVNGDPTDPTKNGLAGKISEHEKILVDSETGEGLVSKFNNLNLKVAGDGSLENPGIEGNISELQEIVTEQITDGGLRETVLNDVKELSLEDIDGDASASITEFNQLKNVEGGSLLVKSFNELEGKTDEAIGVIGDFRNIDIDGNTTIASALEYLKAATGTTSASLEEISEVYGDLIESVAVRGRVLESKYALSQEVIDTAGFMQLPEYYRGKYIATKNEEKSELQGVDVWNPPPRARELKFNTDLEPTIFGLDKVVYVETEVFYDNVLVFDASEEDWPSLKENVYEYKMTPGKGVQQTVYGYNGHVYQRTSTWVELNGETVEFWPEDWAEITDNVDADKKAQAKAIIGNNGTRVEGRIEVTERTVSNIDGVTNEIKQRLDATLGENNSTFEAIRDNHATRDYVGGQFGEFIENNFIAKDGTLSGSIAKRLSQAWSDDYSSTATAVENLTASYGENNSTVEERATAFADAHKTTVDIVNEIDSTFKTNEASAAENLKTFADDSKASASKLSQLTAVFGGEEGNIDAVIAKLSKIETVTANASGAHATIDERLTASFTGIGQDIQKLGQRVESISIGGTNLLRNSDFIKAGEWWELLLTGIVAIESSNIDGKLDNTVKLSNGGSFLQTGVLRRMPAIASVWVKGTGTIIAHGQNAKTLPEVAEVDSTEYVKYSFELEDRGNTNLVFISTGEVEIERVKLELGTIATDWSPAPEDIETSIKDVSGRFGEFKTDYDKAIEDGVITPAEGRSLEFSAQKILSDGQELQFQYDALSKNSQVNAVFLNEFKNKTTLVVNQSQRIYDLIKGIARKSTLTDNDTTLIESEFGIYNSLVKEYHEAYEKAVDSVNKTYVTEELGTAVKELLVEYYVSSNPDTPTGGSWSTDTPQWSETAYIFSRTRAVLHNGEEKLSESVNITGARGATGPRGPTGSTGPIGKTGPRGLTGPQGEQGLRGAPGSSSYTHVAYATGPNGEGFNHNHFHDATYIGIVVNEDKDSTKTSASDYKWSLIKGLKGDEGIPGDPGKDGLTPHLHIAYADSADGTVGMVIDEDNVDVSNKLYIGQCTTYLTVGESVADPTDPSRYRWTLIKGAQGEQGIQGPVGPQGEPGLHGLDGLDGAQGIQGPIGPKGESSYTHIAYGTSASGGGFRDAYFPDATYIGIVVNSNKSSIGLKASDYNWSKIKGEKGDKGDEGAPGPIGPDGKRAWFHVAYADSADGSVGFVNNEKDPGVDVSNKMYIGQYTDYSETDSNNPSDYAWTKIKADERYTWIKYADNINGIGMVDNPDGKEYIGFAYNQLTPDESSNPKDYKWSLIKGTQGIQGPSGKNATERYTWVMYADDANGNGITSNSVGKEFMGIAFNQTSPTPSTTNKTAYKWSKIRGEKGDTGPRGPIGPQGVPGNPGLAGLDGKDGVDGLPGKDGESSYTHIAYGTSAAGAGFKHAHFAAATYIGITVNKNPDSSTTKASDYKWSLIKGAKGDRGAQGVPGNPGKDGLTPYLHIAYADSADGTVGFVNNEGEVDVSNKLYIGQYTSYSANGESINDSANPADYTWTLIKGAKGEQGIRGPVGPQGDPGLRGLDGKDGKTGLQGPIGPKGESSYTHIAYATTASGGGFKDTYFPDATYIGIVVNKTESSVGLKASDYNWSKIKGEKGDTGDRGAPGIKGADGKQAWFHVAYADSADGSVGFVNNEKADGVDISNKKYIGQYTDYKETDSEIPSDYKWTKIKADERYTWIKYASNPNGTGMVDNPDGMEYIGLAYNQLTERESSNPADYTWSKTKGEQGIRGPQGASGKDATQRYTWVVYATDAAGTGISTTSTNKTYMGIAYNQLKPTPDLSNKSVYSWTLIRGADGPKGDTGPRGPQGPQGIDGLEGPKGDQGIEGPKGVDGKSSYTHIAYAANANGTGFSVAHFPAATYIGMYVDDKPEDEAKDATKYKWSLIKGADGARGVPGNPGKDGLTPYLHIAYATNATGTAGFSTTVSAGKTYIGQYTDYKEEDGTDPKLYKWTLIKGATGSTGPRGPIGETGRAVEYIKPQYALHGSRTIAPATGSSAWKDTMPALDPSVTNQWIWIRHETKYDDGQVTHTVPTVDTSWEAVDFRVLANDAAIKKTQEVIADEKESTAKETKALQGVWAESVKQYYYGMPVSYKDNEWTAISGGFAAVSVGDFGINISKAGGFYAYGPSIAIPTKGSNEAHKIYRITVKLNVPVESTNNHIGFRTNTGSGFWVYNNLKFKTAGFEEFIGYASKDSELLKGLTNTVVLPSAATSISAAFALNHSGTRSDMSLEYVKVEEITGVNASKFTETVYSTNTQAASTAGSLSELVTSFGGTAATPAQTGAAIKALKAAVSDANGSYINVMQWLAATYSGAVEDARKNAEQDVTSRLTSAAFKNTIDTITAEKGFARSESVTTLQSQLYDSVSKWSYDFKDDKASWKHHGSASGEYDFEGSWGKFGNNAGNDQLLLISDKYTIPVKKGLVYKIVTEVRIVSGGGRTYIGFAGIKDDIGNFTNNDIGQHYITNFSGTTTTFREIIGYASTDAESLKGLTNTVVITPTAKYIRPLVLVNHNGVPGQTIVKYVNVEAMDNVQAAYIQQSFKTVDGLKNKYALEANSNGYVTGMYVTNSDGDVTSKTSDITFIADNFNVATSASGGKLRPFRISGNKVYAKDLIVESANITGSLTVGHLPDNAITLNKLVPAEREKINKAANDIANLEIGGKNLFVLSATGSGYESAGKFTASSATHKTMLEPILVKGRKFITYQHWNPNKWVNSSDSNRIGFLTEAKVHISSVTLPTVNSEEYRSNLITIPANAHYALLGAIVNPSDLNAVKIKYEFGNKATDWSPAPEDVDADIEAADKKADQAIGWTQLALSAATSITADNKITPNEKRELLRIKDEIVSTHTELLKSVNTVPGATTPTTYGTAYSNVTTRLTNATASPTTTTDITTTDRTNLTNALSTYFTQRAKLNDTLVTKAKEYAESQAAAAKTHANNIAKVEVIDSLTKRFISPASYSSRAATVKGLLVIETPITASRMVKLNITGYNYQADKTNIDLSVGFYFNGAFHNFDYADMGTYPLEYVSLAINAGKVVILIGSIGSTWSYPKINVTQAIVGYQNPPDTYKSGWNIKFLSTLNDVAAAGYTGLTAMDNIKSVSIKSLQDNVYSPGTTKINGGNIETGTVTAAKISTDKLSAISADLGDITAGSIKGASIEIGKISDGGPGCVFGTILKASPGDGFQIMSRDQNGGIELSSTTRALTVWEGDAIRVKVGKLN